MTSVDFITTADGTTLLRRSWAPVGERKAGMVIVHGLGEHCGRYDHVGAYFAEHGIEVQSIDLRGCGESEGERSFVTSLDEFLDDLEPLVAELTNRGTTILLGHSLGGLLALLYAVSDRARPDLLVLSAPAIGARVPMIKRIAGRILGRIAPKAMIPNELTGDQLSRDPAVGEAYFSDPLVQQKTSAGMGLAFLNGMDQAQATMHTLSLPTFVIHGGADPLVPPNITAPLALIDGVERRLFPAYRHEIFNEVGKEAVLEAVGEWIDGQLTRA